MTKFPEAYIRRQAMMSRQIHSGCFVMWLSQPAYRFYTEIMQTIKWADTWHCMKLFMEKIVIVCANKILVSYLYSTTQMMETPAKMYGYNPSIKYAYIRWLHMSLLLLWL